MRIFSDVAKGIRLGGSGPEDNIFARSTLMSGTYRGKDFMRPIPVYGIDHSYLDYELIDWELTQPSVLTELKRRHPESKRSNESLHIRRKMNDASHKIQEVRQIQIPILSKRIGD